MHFSVFKNIWESMNQTLEVVSQPKTFFEKIVASQDIRVAWAALSITSVLFAGTSVIAEVNKIPLSAAPLLPLPNYRLLQALFMPLILGLGWLVISLAALILNSILRGRGGWKRTLAVSAPALFVPMWLMLWPSEMAISLGMLDPNDLGFAGLWSKHLMPACTFLYILVMTWLAYWLAFRLLLREAFALAVLSIIPTLGLFSVILR